MMDPEVKPRLSSRTHLAETCPECRGDGFTREPPTPLDNIVATQKCAPCNGSGRVVRFTHDPRSDNTQDDTDAEIEGLKAEVERLAAELAAHRGGTCVACGDSENEATQLICALCLETIETERDEAAADRSALLDAARKAQAAVSAAHGYPGIRDHIGTEIHDLLGGSLSALSAVLTPNSQPGSSSVGAGPFDETGNARAALEAKRALAERVREEIARWWDDTEPRSAEAHAVYQEEAHRRGDVRHPDAYEDLSEATKEWDRVLVRWVARAIRRLDLSTLLGGSDAA